MKKEYDTSPRRALLSFFQQSRHGQFTIEQIYNSIEDAAKPGKSTVYRLINQMVEQGTVRRFVPDNSRHFLYQYTGCSSPKSHLHLKCTSCGCLLHMEDKRSEEMLAQFMKLQNFELDEEKTLLYGRCESCCRKGKEETK